MSEKIYAWLLRLYPSRFREAYGHEALQLIRDRARDERGFFPSLRLWLDLLADLAISVPREYRHGQPALVGASARQGWSGLPSFHVLGGESPRLGALLFGGVLSLVTLSAFPVLISPVGNYRPPGASLAQSQRPAYERSSAFRRPAPQAADDAEEDTATSGQAAMATTRFSSGDAMTSDSYSTPLPLSRSGFSPPQAQPPRAQPPAGAMIDALNADVKLDAAERRRVIDRVVANLKQYYIDPAVAQTISDALLAHEKNGDYDAAMDGQAFADLLTRQLRDVGHDMHLDVFYSQNPFSDRPPEPTAEDLARYRKAMEQENCTFEKVQILPHNIGYFKLNSFPDASLCRQKAAAVMASLNGTDAIVFDLRDNRGGDPNMVALIAAYLFDHPEYLYNPREDTMEQSWTRSPVPGNRLADKPAYVLTSARTFSGAEHFSYDLKMLKRATLVGETTGGATDVGIFHRIDDHFGMGIRGTKAINPYSEPDWAVTGVEPDVKVKAADALETAEKLAESKLQKK